ncbi:MAG TPA: hypothetical protein VJQ52_03510 [Steroidobacteraceae bacterium]|nr:hypothetical protein [Steroidobacteraceae bacterium]
MSRILRIHRVVATLLLATAPLASSLAADSGLVARIAACTRERDDTQRLACFDRAAALHEEMPDRMTATVAALEKRPRGELVFTLDNGQVWAQKSAGAYFPVQVGATVTVLAGTLGSFRLIAGSRATAVTRVR